MALRFPLGLLGLLLISCSQEFVLSNSTPSFAEGYRAGCKSGSSVASNMTGEIIKDDKRYLNDAEYASGWRPCLPCLGFEGQSKPTHGANRNRRPAWGGLLMGLD